MPKFLTKFFLLFAGTILAAAFFYSRVDDLAKFSRDLAINKAVEAGVYQCCIEPPCTMCYWEGNPWNNQTAGTCDCDNLTAAGKEPCPQCFAGLCEESSGGICEGDGD